MSHKQEPHRHHFLPVFFLKKWAGADGRLVEFSKPYGNVVKPKRVHPKGTGFIDRLYAIEGFPGDLSYEVEKNFLSPVDSRAAIALEAMLIGQEPRLAEREAWARFLVSLLLRMPTEITLLKDLAQCIDGEIAGGIGRMLLRHAPDEYHGELEQAFTAYMKEPQIRLTENVLRVLSADDIVPLIAAMHWQMIDLSDSPHELLVSDRPVIIYKDKSTPSETTIALPVGPRKVFIAATKPFSLRKLREANPKRLAAAINVDIVAGASRLVYGGSDRQILFVQNRMGTNKNPSFVARILSNAGLNVANLAERIASFQDASLKEEIVTKIKEHKLQQAPDALGQTATDVTTPLANP